jgi:hypothetical protein
LANGFLAGILAIVVVSMLMKSGPEFRAVLWHHRHGDHFTVNGITFPLYYWYSPELENTNFFSVWDNPGPLRPADDRLASFVIYGYRDHQGVPSD